MERLDKFLSDNLTDSRSKARELIKSGRVSVNDVVVRTIDCKVDPNTDVICCDGEVLGAKPARTILMLHKPAGCVTAVTDKTERTVMEYLPKEYQKLRPVGRLDKETEGLLLFTDDGDLAHKLISPKHGVEKLYYAEHEGECTADDVAIFAQGCVLRDGTVCLPAGLEPQGAGKSLVRVHEGKYHQVRRMLASLGKPVTYLRRIAEGGLTLGTLPVGMYRKVTEGELEQALAVNFDEGKPAES